MICFVLLCAAAVGASGQASGQATPPGGRSSAAPNGAAGAVSGASGSVAASGVPQVKQSSPTAGVLGVLGAPTPAAAGSVPVDAPVIAVSVDGATVTSGQSISLPATPVANTSDPITITISNTGGSTLELDRYAPPELYGDGSMMYLIDYSTYTPTIDPGESMSFKVTFFPYQTGTDAATLVIISNDPATPQFEIDLSGKGLPMSDADGTQNGSTQTNGAR